MKFTINFTRSATDHVRSYRKFEQRIILNAITEQLTYEPASETRNRKPLGANQWSSWELRVDKYRVFYDVISDESTAIVKIKAVGHKEHNTLYIGGKEVKL